MAHSAHFMTPWRVGPYSLHVFATSTKGGDVPVCDVRGWGYLTGNGGGGLALDADTAKAEQDKNANLIAAAPELYAQLESLLKCVELTGQTLGDMDAVRAVLAKARGEPQP